MRKSDPYIGFAVKKGSVIYGFEALLERTKNVKLILIDHTTNPKIVKKLEDLKDYIPCKMARIEGNTISNIIKTTNTKVLSITDSQLAKTIYNTCEDIVQIKDTKKEEK